MESVSPERSRPSRSDCELSPHEKACDLSQHETARKHYRRWLRHVGADAEEVLTCLLSMQWIAAITAILAAAWCWRTGPGDPVLPIWIAMAGSALSGIPLVLLAIKRSSSFGKYIIAAAQMLWSVLLIQMAGHRPETYAHLFGSLLLLSLFHDVRVLGVASAVVFGQVVWNVASGGGPSHGLTTTHLAFWGLLFVVWLTHRALYAHRHARHDAREAAAKDQAQQADRVQTAEASIDSHEQLLCSAGCLAVLLDVVDGAVCIADGDGEVMFANRAWAKRWGSRARPMWWRSVVATTGRGARAEDRWRRCCRRRCRERHRSRWRRPMTAVAHVACG